MTPHVYGFCIQEDADVTDPDSMWINYADFDGDGRTDAICTDTETGRTTIMLMAGDAPDAYWDEYDGYVEDLEGIGVDKSVRWQDANGDGKADMFVLDKATGMHYIYINKGDGVFDDVGLFLSYFCATDDDEENVTYYVDFNGDGYLDVMCW